MIAKINRMVTNTYLIYKEEMFIIKNNSTEMINNIYVLRLDQWFQTGLFYSPIIN